MGGRLIKEEKIGSEKEDAAVSFAVKFVAKLLRCNFVSNFLPRIIVY